MNFDLKKGHYSITRKLSYILLLFLYLQQIQIRIPQFNLDFLVLQFLRTVVYIHI